MYFIFTFCDCSPWIPWLLPFILGWFFGMRMIRRYRSRISELESSKMKDSNRIAELEQDVKMSRTKLESEDDHLRKARQRITEVEAQLALTKGSLYELEEQSTISTATQSSPTKSIGLKAAAAVATSTAFVADKINTLEEVNIDGTSTIGEAINTPIVTKESIEAQAIDHGEEATDVPVRDAWSSSTETTTDKEVFIDSKTLNSEIETESEEISDIVSEKINLDSDTIAEADEIKETISESTTDSFIEGDSIEETISESATDTLVENDSLNEAISESSDDLSSVTDSTIDSHYEIDPIDTESLINETTEDIKIEKDLDVESMKENVSESVSSGLDQTTTEIKSSIDNIVTEESDVSNTGFTTETTNPMIESDIDKLTADETAVTNTGFTNDTSTSEIESDIDKVLTEQTDASNAGFTTDATTPEIKSDIENIVAEQPPESYTGLTSDESTAPIETDDSNTGFTTDSPSSSPDEKEDSGLTETLGLSAAAAAVGTGSILGKTGKSDPTKDSQKGTSAESTPGKSKSSKKSTVSKTPKKRNKYFESGFKQPASGRFKNVDENDLAAIEGVGPKTAEVLKKNGIKSWSDLATKTPLEIKEILATSGSRFSHIDPSSWPRQAKLASGNHWTRLEKLQDEMDGGKVSTSSAKAKSSTAKAKTKTAKSNAAKSKAKATKSKTDAKAKSSRSVEKKSTVKNSPKKETKASVKAKQTAKKSKTKTKATASSAKQKSPKKESKKAIAKTKKTVAKSKSKLSTSKKKKSNKTKSPKISVGRAVKTSNLQVIEGIGPKMNELLVKEGISSWSKLAKYSPAQLKSKLEKHGDRYRIIDVKHWPKQAAYASKNQWNKLIQFQKKDGSESKAEKLLQKAGVFERYKKNDLKVIEGIGPKIEELLQNAGIKTWAALSKASKSKLSGILSKAGKRYGLADPSSWPKQASLAASGKFDKLEALQKRL